MTDLVYYDTIRSMHYRVYLCAPKSWGIASLIFRTEPNEKTVMKKQKKQKNKHRGAQKKRSVIKSVELVLGSKGSPWWERFAKEVGRQPGVKERGSYRWWELWADIVRKCGRSMSRQVIDRWTGIRLTERRGISTVWWGIPIAAMGYTQSCGSMLK